MPSFVFDAAARQRADKLVERIVPPDILAQRHDARLRRPERRRMHRMRLLVQRLQRADGAQSPA